MLRDLSEAGIRLRIRRLTPEDSLEALTELLHRAYAGLAAMGLEYVATCQSVEITRKRLRTGICYLALDEDRIIGTIKYAPPGMAPGSDYFSQRHVAHVSQFGVEPELQGQGVGSRLMVHCEARALNDGATELALDTAVPAEHLIRWYTALGYREVGRIDWPVTNYESVILSKQLRP